MRPNVLLITADQWRGDCLGTVGHPVVKTPHLDQLAETATVFERHFATTAPCSPARASLYTGLYQMNHRVIWNGAPLDNRFDNIARAGRRAGYTPTLFGYTDIAPDPRVHAPADPALQSFEGVLPGFSVYQPLPESDAPWISWLAERGHGPEQLHAIHHVEPQDGERISRAPARYTAEESQTAFLTNIFLEWLAQQRTDAAWFAHISYISPHPPLTQPAPYNTLYAADDGPAFRGADTASAAGALHPLSKAILDYRKLASHMPGASGLVKDITRSDFSRLRALYYGAISEVDAQLGRLFAALEAAGAADNTIIIFTSDHAEMMGDYWMLGKGGIHEESYHIPLIVRMPGGAKGGRVGQFTSAVDVFPTLLDVWGLSPGHAPDGESLRPFLAGQSPLRWRQAALWEYDFRNLEVQPDDLDATVWPTEKSVLCRRSETQLYVHSAALPSELYDYQPDRSLQPVDTSTGRGLQNLAEVRGALLSERLKLADNTLAQKLV